MPLSYRDTLQKLVDDARILGGSRMFRDGEPVTEDLAAQNVERFKAFLLRTGKSQLWAARSLGIAESTLSQVLTGGYGADAGKHHRAIDKWLEKQIMKEAAPKPPGFVRTGVVEKIYGAINLAVKTSSMALITGPSGCGKTMTLQAIRAETPGAIFISIDSASRAVRGVLQSLGAALRMTTLQMSRAQQFKQLAALLADTDRLILVDEVHKLAGRANDDALHVLRDLHDATKCPMVLCGNGKIARYIRDNHTDGFDPLDQIYGRISIWMDLAEAAGLGADGGAQLFTVADIQRVFAASKIRITPDASRYLAELACEPSFGCLRAAKYIVSLALLVAGDQAVTADMLRTIQVDRLGRRGAEAVEIRIGERLQAVA